MTRNCRVILVAGLALGCAASFAQKPQEPDQEPINDARQIQLLQAAESRTLAHTPISETTRLYCDNEGNPYFISDTQLRPNEVVNRWDLHDNKLVRIDVSKTPELNGLTFQHTYGVSGDGDAYLAAFQRPEAKGQLPKFYIVRFKKDGSFASKIRIEQDIGILQIGAFANGDLIVTGFRAERKRLEPMPPRQYFVAMFHEDGTFIRELKSPEDPEVTAGISNKDPLYTSADFPTPNDKTIETGNGRIGPDGNFYSFRRKEPAEVLVYSPGGELLRSLRLHSPREDLTATWFQPGNGSIAIYYKPEEGPGMFATFDSETGERQSILDGQGFSQAFACYVAPDKFTVLSATREGQLTVKVLSPR